MYHRLCSGLADQDPADISQLFCNLLHRCLHVHIVLYGLLIGYSHIGKHLRIHRKPLCQFTKLLSRYYNFHDFQASQDSIACACIGNVISFAFVAKKILVIEIITVIRTSHFFTNSLIIIPLVLFFHIIKIYQDIFSKQYVSSSFKKLFLFHSSIAAKILLISSNVFTASSKFCF